MEPSSRRLFEQARLPPANAARLLALADGLCAIGQLRTGRRAGQFSIFNFLVRCADDTEHVLPDGRTAYVVLMRAGIFRRHAWYARFWLPQDDAPLRLQIPSPIDKSWHWIDDVEEIEKRLDQSEAWQAAVGRDVAAHSAAFAELLDQVEALKLDGGPAG